MTDLQEPVRTGRLNVGDGHELHFECYGNHNGRPAVILHGGPGGHAHAGYQRFFDLETTYVVLFDQRGCGRSTPSAHLPDVDLATNTTDHLVADLEQLREHFGFTTWDVVGVSWGAVLAVVYAQTFPHRVSALIPALLGDPSADGVNWTCEGVGMFFPEHHQQLRASIPDRHQQPRVIDAVNSWINDPDEAERYRAALAWGHWEDTHISLVSGFFPSPMWQDQTDAIRFTRLVAHYWAHHNFITYDLRDRMAALDGIPGAIVNGRQDISSPLSFAWDCAQHWPTGSLVVLEHTGHGHSAPGVTQESLPDVVRAQLTKARNQ